MRFPAEHFDDIEPVELDCIVDDAIPSQGLGFCYGPSIVGKSAFVIDLAGRIGQGREVLGKYTRRVGVAYIAAEGANGVRKRIKAWRQENPGATACALISRPVNLLDQAQVEDLVADLRAHGRDMLELHGVAIELICFDTLAACMPGASDSDTAQISLAIDRLQYIATALSAFVLIVTHTGKDEGRGIRGWSGQFAAADLVICISKAADEGAPSTGSIEKFKDGEGGLRFAFHLRQVTIGQNQRGKPITSIVPEFEDAPPRRQNALSRRLSPTQEKVLRAIRICTEAGQTVPASGDGVKPGTLGVSRVAIRAKALDLGLFDSDEKPDSIKRSINRALNDLGSKGLIRADSEAAWIV